MAELRVLCVDLLESAEEEVSQGKLLMYNRAELKTSDHRSQLHLLVHV